MIGTANYMLFPLVLREYMGFDESGVSQFRLIWPEGAEEAFVDTGVLRAQINLSNIDENTFYIGDVKVSPVEMNIHYTLLERAE